MPKKPIEIKKGFRYYDRAPIKVIGRKGELQIEHPVMLRIPSIDKFGTFALVDRPAYRLTDDTYVWETDISLVDKTKVSKTKGRNK